MEDSMNELERSVYAALMSVVDPELYISIIDLGLIYDIKVENGKAKVKMTFTSMACPAGPQMRDEVYNSCLRIDGIEEADVEVVWNPPWNPRLMASEEAQMQMGIY